MEQANNIQATGARHVNNVPEHPVRLPILVEFGFSIWGTKKQDKSSYQAIANGTGADTESVEGRRDIMRSDKLTAIRKFAANARNQIHYSSTLPWSDMGLRLLTYRWAVRLQQAMSRGRAGILEARGGLLSDYDFDVSQRQAEAEKLAPCSTAGEGTTPPTDVLRGKVWLALHHVAHTRGSVTSALDLQGRGSRCNQAAV